MKSTEIRKKFLEYFKNKDHKIVPSSSLVTDDPSVLLTSAGMQQFKEYFTGSLDPETTEHPGLGSSVGKNATSIQKCFRTSDIEEVGDSSHLTFFEMLGNFSFSGYFKEEAIKYAYEFITEEMGLEVEYVTIFDPNEVSSDSWLSDVPFDEDAFNIWKEEIGLSEEKIKRFGKDNFWGPTGSEGPCGPTTEIFVKNKRGEDIEIWNLVFNEFYCDEDKNLSNLEQPGIDTGMGLERLVSVVQDKETIFDTDLFQKPFGDLFKNNKKKNARIIADHLRGAVFLLSDGVIPSNKEEGYILRRLIRRVLVHSRKINISKDKITSYIENIINFYGDHYSDLKDERDNIIKEFNIESESFKEALERGLKEFNKNYPKEKHGKIEGKDAFDLYQSYGFPLEIIKELAEERGYAVDEKGFNKAFEEHKEVSKAGSEEKFGGHGLKLDTGELKAKDDKEMDKVLRLHTVTHLMQKALRNVLGEEVKQMGSDINVDRTRFDFYSDRKLTEEEVEEVEKQVNEVIEKDYPVRSKEMPKEDAEKTKALSFFRAKYPDEVTIYYIGPEDGGIEDAYSAEFCAGPHVERTGVIGKFKVIKQESVGRDTKRIRATVE